ncbi:MAG: hypothetical protein R2706_05575 [Acidimicrobiales bacterium]
MCHSLLHYSKNRAVDGYEHHQPAKACQSTGGQSLLPLTEPHSAPSSLAPKPIDCARRAITSGQRLVEPTEIAIDLAVTDASLTDGHLDLAFSDGHSCRLQLNQLLLDAALRSSPSSHRQARGPVRPNPVGFIDWRVWRRSRSSHA